MGVFLSLNSLSLATQKSKNITCNNNAYSEQVFCNISRVHTKNAEIKPTVTSNHDYESQDLVDRNTLLHCSVERNDAASTGPVVLPQPGVSI